MEAPGWAERSLTCALLKDLDPESMNKSGYQVRRQAMRFKNGGQTKLLILQSRFIGGKRLNTSGQLRSTNQTATRVPGIRTGDSECWVDGETRSPHTASGVLQPHLWGTSPQTPDCYRGTQDSATPHPRVSPGEGTVWHHSSQCPHLEKPQKAHGWVTRSRQGKRMSTDHPREG